MVIRAELDNLINDPAYVREKRLEIFDHLEKAPSVRIPVQVPEQISEQCLLEFAMTCRKAAESLHRGIGVQVCPAFFSESFLETEELKMSPSAPWLYKNCREFAHLYLTKGLKDETALVATLEGVAHLGAIAGMIYVACAHHKDEKVAFWNPEQSTWKFDPDFIRRYDGLRRRAVLVKAFLGYTSEDVPS